MRGVLSLGASSVGPAEIARLRKSAEAAAWRLPFALQWAAEGEAESADVLIIDVDTIYGHVEWLRAQAAGRALLALTSRPNGAHNHELVRDADGDALAALLVKFEALAHPASPVSADPIIAPGASTPGASTPGAATSKSRSFAVTTELPATSANRAASGRDALSPTRELPALGGSAATQSPVMRRADGSDATSSSSASTATAGPLPRRDAMALHDWLRDADGIEGVASLRIDDDAPLVVDRPNGVYYGPATLKALLPLATGSIPRTAWQPVSAPSIAALASGREPQPLSRLRLLAGLGGFNGNLRPDLDPSLSLRLPRWPQIEREFPRHVRIATALMKGPATLDELVTQLGVPYAEVADFINGFEAAGFIEQVASAPIESASTSGGEGLFGRFRTRGRKP